MSWPNLKLSISGNTAGGDCSSYPDDEIVQKRNLVSLPFDRLSRALVDIPVGPTGRSDTNNAGAELLLLSHLNGRLVASSRNSSLALLSTNDQQLLLAAIPAKSTCQ